jgi:hypothetical protein
MRTKNNFIKIKTENHIKRYYLYEISKKKKEGIKMWGSESMNIREKVIT